MKNLVKGVIYLSVVFFVCLKSNAQKSPVVREPDMKRPSLFQNLPNKISCNVDELSDALESQTGKTVSFSLAGNLNFQGVVTSTSSDPDNRIQSIAIRSTNFPGAIFSFSRILKEDKTKTFVGSMISFQHGDAYEIGEENGRYYFIKKGFYDLINE